MERFYLKVNPIVHNRNLLKDSIINAEKAEAYQLKKAERLKENDIRTLVWRKHTIPKVSDNFVNNNKLIRKFIHQCTYRTLRTYI